MFATPTVLSSAPQLVGYYRLLLGRPQKSFYGSDRFGAFKSMEIGVDRVGLHADSPHTSVWFDISQALARDGDTWIDFKRRIEVAIGIPVT